MNKELYKPFLNKTKSNHKYKVYVKSNSKSGLKLIGFGHKDFKQYHDKLNNYSHLDHNDKKRKELYYKRFGNTNDKDTAKYWSHKILW